MQSVTDCISERGTPMPIALGTLGASNMLTGLKRIVEIVWCRRIDAHCYELGTRFAESTPRNGA